MTDSTSPAQISPSAQAVSERLSTAALGMVDVLAVYLGDRLGWYRSLSVEGPATAEELARRTGTSVRYAQEWLEQQAITGLLEVEEGTAGSSPRSARFVLPPGAAEALTDERSLTYIAPLARMFAASAIELPSLLSAYRSGGGVAWGQYGADARESQADMNRPWFESVLADALAGVADLDARLRRPEVRIADIGCGAGWSSIALARAYPDALVEGFDVDAPSAELARANAAESELESRLSFHLADAGNLPQSQYEAVFAFECIHDVPRPVDVLAAARRGLVPGGSVVVMDEAVADAFDPPGDELERLMYGFSLLICLPDGMAHPHTAATGTVMRPSTLRSYADEAGFTGVQFLPIENFGFWRFYQLTI